VIAILQSSNYFFSVIRPREDITPRLTGCLYKKFNARSCQIKSECASMTKCILRILTGIAWFYIFLWHVGQNLVMTSFLISAVITNTAYYRVSEDLTIVILGFLWFRQLMIDGRSFFSKLSERKKTVSNTNYILVVAGIMVGNSSDWPQRNKYSGFVWQHQAGTNGPLSWYPQQQGAQPIQMQELIPEGEALLTRLKKLFLLNL